MTQRLIRSLAIALSTAIVAATPGTAQSPADSPRRIGKSIRPPDVEYFLRGSISIDSLQWRGQADIVFRNTRRDTVDRLHIVLPTAHDSPGICSIDVPLDSVLYHNAPVACKRSGDTLIVIPPEPLPYRGVGIVTLSCRTRWQKPDWRRFDDALVLRNWYPRLVIADDTGKLVYSARTNVSAHLFVDTAWVLVSPAELMNERTLFGIPLAFGDGVQLDVLQRQIKTPDGQPVRVVYLGGARPYQLTAARVDQMPLALLRSVSLDRITLAPTTVDLYRTDTKTARDSSLALFAQYFAASLQDRLGPCPLERLVIVISTTVDADITVGGGLAILHTDPKTSLYRLAETIARSWIEPFPDIEPPSTQIEKGLAVWLTLAALVDDPNAVHWQSQLLTGYENLMKRNRDDEVYERAVRAPSMLQFLSTQAGENIYWDIVRDRTRFRAADTGMAWPMRSAFVRKLASEQVRLLNVLDTLTIPPDITISRSDQGSESPGVRLRGEISWDYKGPIRVQTGCISATRDTLLETVVIGNHSTGSWLAACGGRAAMLLDPNGLIPDANRANNSLEFSGVAVGPKRFTEKYPPYRFFKRPRSAR